MKPVVSRVDAHTGHAYRAIEHCYAADGFQKAAIREYLAAHAWRSMADLHRIGKVPGLLPEGADGTLVHGAAERDDILGVAAGGAAGGYSAAALTGGHARGPGKDGVAILFEETGRAMAQAHGAGGFAWTLTPHPISTKTPEDLAERARRLAEEVVAPLTRLP